MRELRPAAVIALALRAVLLALLAAALSAVPCLAATPSGALPIELSVVDAGGNDFVLSPDQKLFAVTRGNNIVLSDAVTGLRLHVLRGHNGYIGRVAFSPDSRVLASTSGDGTVRLWDVVSGREILRIDRKASFGHSIAISPDGSTLALLNDYATVDLVSVATGKVITTLDAHLPGSEYDYGTLLVAYSADGRRVAWTAGLSVVIADVSGKTPPVEIKTYYPNYYSFHGLRFLANDRLALIAEGSVNIYGLDGSVQSSAILSPSGIWGFAANDREFAFVDTKGLHRVSADTGAVIASSPPTTLAGNLYFAPNGQDIIFYDGRSLRTWRAGASGFEQPTLTPALELSTLAFSDDDGALVSFGRGVVVRWNLSTGRPDALTPSNAFDFVAPDKGVSADQRTTVEDYRPDPSSPLAGVGVYDTKTGKRRRLISEAPALFNFGLSRDGRWLAIEDWQADPKTVGIWDTGSGERVSTLPSASTARGIAFSADGSRVALVDDPGMDLVIWDWQAAQPVVDYGDFGFDSDQAVVGAIWDEAFSEDGRSLAILTSEGVELRDAQSGALVWRQAEDMWSGSIAFSPDGTRLVASNTHAAVEVRSAESGDLLRSISASNVPDCVALSHDNRTLAVSINGIVELYDMSTGGLLGRLVAFENSEWVAMTGDGFFQSSDHGSAQLNVARGLDTYPIDGFYQALFRPDLVVESLKGDPGGKVAAAAAKLDLITVLGSGGAPSVIIDAPRQVTESDSVEISATVTDGGGGIGKIEWRVNGVTQGVETRGLGRLDPGIKPPPGGRTLRVTRSLTLDPGDNQIELVAYNAEGLIASDPAAITVRWDGASASTPPTLHVLAVGVNDYYDSRLRLAYAVPDAQAIGAAFEAAGKGLYASVDVTTVLDGDVTAAHLDAVFAGLGAKVKPRDVFVLFMSGHGKTQDGRYYFLPADFRYVDDSSVAAGGIDQDRFQSWLAQIPARKSVLLYDTCDSGSLTTSGLASRGLEEVAALSRMTRAMGRTVLSASTDDAPALEGYQGHGVFTYALLSALGTGDTDGDGLIDVTELAGSIDRSVPDLSYAAFKFRQVPQMSIVGSNFPLADKTQVLTADTVTIPTAPTHVVIAEAAVHKAAGAAAVVQTLEVGTLVRVVEQAEGWSQVAREGKLLGYVRTKTLVLMH